MGRSDKDRDLERLMPVGTLAVDVTKINGSKSSDQSPSPSSPSSHHSAKEAFGKHIHSWLSKKFVSGCVILFPIAITFYLTWKLINFVDGFFSPIYNHLGIDVFGSVPRRGNNTR
ncbi:protein CONTINUOUS VASCULAR RING 1-like [Solanum tuberosum]|uniref:protein CONTINUOUS VASCULAR RING 1-like n=1 Tax=Solanum tuberosum TaxID=4113 RepID=UPI00073A0125|nr:PREDICTED: protein CONTINUOUS VASCULAR RING 1-like [Solanum tuberosum]